MAKIFKYGIACWNTNMHNEYYDRAGFVGRFEKASEELPAALFYAVEEQRDRVLLELAEQHPGKMFAKFEVTECAYVQPGDLTVASVSDKGVLPK